MIYRAKKSLGQNFLKSEAALREIIKAGEIKPDDIILEIGPGKGALTKKLLATSCQLIAIEKDFVLYEFLKSKFEDEISSGQLRLINDDILSFDLNYELQAKNYKLIANIPYNITGAILKKFLTEKNQPERMILMLQHEVAQRIMGRNGPASAKATAGKKESILSISVKAYGEPKMIMKVHARYFSPAPKVDSAIISITNISRKLFTSPRPSPCKGEGGNGIAQNKFLSNQAFETRFWEIVKTGFAHKRKKLSGNLKNVIFYSKSALVDLGNKRAEDLALLDWISLAG